MRVLITSGRTIAQGRELYYKDTPEYSCETRRCFVNPFDLMELGATAGDSLLLSTEAGEEVFTATPSEDLASGTVFIPCGPHANAILHARTRGTGAPDYKWLEGSLTRSEAPPRSSWEVLIGEGGTVCPPVSAPCTGENNGGTTTIRDVACPLCGARGGMSERAPSARGEVRAAPFLHFHSARVFFMPRENHHDSIACCAVTGTGCIRQRIRKS